MARIVPDELKEIIETSLGDGVLWTFINGANLIVTKHLGSSTELSDDQRKEIERWLSAHLLTAREQQAASEGADKASITYQGSYGMGLDATFYGQQVKLMDTSGILDSVVGKRAATLHAVTSFA